MTNEFKEAIEKVLLTALKLYREALFVRDDIFAEKARDYLFNQRHISKKVISDYGIGLAPRAPIGFCQRW